MKRWLKKQKGLTQLEFSLIALAVVLVLFMIIEFALYFYSVQMVNEITRRSARLATVCFIADRDEIPQMPAVANLYPSGFTAANLQIDYLDSSGASVDVSGFLTTPPAASTVLNAQFAQIKYVRAQAVDYEFRFFVLAALINAVGTTPAFETILPAESLGVLKPEGESPAVYSDCSAE
ncbi:TadE family protein [Vibrio alginolyticus]|uniref:TadE/TadG family type IV pilus assembly protein n=1 Tax=Vibrio TaxID=662 RepID=UPI001BD2A6D1|nr:MULTISPECIES: TadE family protein [Vibrio]MBS9933407.1 pilus assembly protein [Vibrio alginolyticus]MBT0107554.1 pilus assembly protein [Vibrio alginolyticus]